MEWNRGPGQTQPEHQAAQHAGTTHPHKKKVSFMNARTAVVGLILCIAILLLAVSGSMVFGGTKPQSKYVDSDKMQAVFLNGGQVYFGKINSINDKFMRVSDIYYLRVNQQVQPDGSQSAANQDISLVKLGCELHGPQDNMVINQDQVIFWENLKDDGQVAKAVAEYRKQNPNGQTCQTNNSSNNSSSTNNNSTTNNATNNTNNSTTNNNTTNNSNTNNNTRR